jgi:predicted CoA-binding protein
MAVDGLGDADIQDILIRTKRIALVGASANPLRASHGVLGFLVRQGFDVTPVNPALAGQALFGRMVVARLAEAKPVEMVDIFRASEHVGAVVEAAIGLGAKVIWMQLGVVNHTAAEAARAVGMQVVMDRCPAIEWRRLGLGAAGTA